MNIFLLRHGETDWNQAGRLQGHTDIPLNQNGRLQISHAAQILADLYPDIDLVITSPLTRARSAFERIIVSFADKDNILVAAHGAILYAMVTTITDGQIAYGGEKVKFEPGSLHLIRYINGTIEVLEIEDRDCAKEAVYGRDSQESE